MALVSANSSVAVNGGVRTALLGTTAPTDATASYAAGWEELGFLHEDGVTEATDVDTEELFAWQGGTLLRRVITSQTTTFAFRCVEVKKATLELRYPGSTVTAGALEVKALESGHIFAFAFDYEDGPTKVRTIVPRAEVSEFEDIEYVSGELVSLGVTLACYPDASGTIMYKYSNSAAWA